MGAEVLKIQSNPAIKNRITLYNYIAVSCNSTDRPTKPFPTKIFDIYFDISKKDLPLRLISQS